MKGEGGGRRGGDALAHWPGQAEKGNLRAARSPMPSGGTTPPQLRLPAHGPACILSPLKVNSGGSRPHSWDFLETKLHLVPLPFLLKLLLLYF